ncbi:endonuclease/exonuclease/phosphatase family protein [Algoriphagus limi]|uniref:Endonuclease/exonuclease/phosphatase family protein n=1 Tax=Algoriphagus limi TaxID=2975273 RepID=A0ABT2G3H0_9BACT|nr:endonuclease/exonuclease/phosphatase family protein [Algoriphagus limi]MCS5489734.1 endonuclease/exonuclease/phosphatase family protein [Algoriphagus limi]
MKALLPILKNAFLISLIIIGSFSPLMAQDQTIKILTYNIYHGEDPFTPGKTNLDSIAILLNELDPDIIALQEVDSMTVRSANLYGRKVNLVDELAKKTGMDGYFAKAMDYSEGGYGEGLLVKKAEYFIHQNLPIPAGGEPRAAAWTSLKIGEKNIWIGGTHLCHQFQENRIAQVQEILGFAESKSNPIIWMGDLNFTPQDNEYQLIKANWKDAAKIAKDESSTYQSATDEGRIDYVWFSKNHFELIGYQVIHVPYSDHFPVLVELKLITP